jgi:hypothetical protein
MLQSNGYYLAPPDVYFNGDFTITAFVNVIITTNWGRIIDFGNGQGNDNIILSLSSGATGQPILEAFESNFYDGFYQSSSVSLSTSSWTHVAGILKGTNSSLYLNCTLTNTKSITASPQNVVRTNNYIGRSNWASDSYANAKFRNLRIYNRALCQSELRTDFNNQ